MRGGGRVWQLAHVGLVWGSLKLSFVLQMPSDTKVLLTIKTLKQLFAP